jgi:hypothetical protein
MNKQEDKKFERVVRRIEPQSRLLRAWGLKGGVSARVTALEIERPDGHTQKMIVRQHGEVDRKHNPRIAADEFRLLQLLRSAGLAVPVAEWVADDAAERTMREKHRWFIAQASEKLSVQRREKMSPVYIKTVQPRCSRC